MALSPKRPEPSKPCSTRKPLTLIRDLRHLVRGSLLQGVPHASGLEGEWVDGFTEYLNPQTYVSLDSSLCFP